MKISVTYSKTGNEMIKVEIHVADREDYPTTHIFGAGETIANIEKFTLAESDEFSMTSEFPSSKEAIEAVEATMVAIKKELDKWRQIRVPDEMEYII